MSVCEQTQLSQQICIDKCGNRWYTPYSARSTFGTNIVSLQTACCLVFDFLEPRDINY